jgi:hypothetical protein
MPTAGCSLCKVMKNADNRQWIRTQEKILLPFMKELTVVSIVLLRP